MKWATASFLSLLDGNCWYQVERETLQTMQTENEEVLARLTQEIYDLAGEGLISIRLNSWEAFSLKNWVCQHLSLRKAKQATLRQ